LANKRDIFLIVGGRLATALITLISIRVVTTYLTPPQYGELALLLTVQMFCGLFLVNPIGQHINLHTHLWWDDGTLVRRLSSYKKYILAVSLVGSLVVLGMNKQDSIEHIIWVVVAMSTMIIAGTWNTTLIPMLNMLGFRSASVFWGVNSAIAALVCSMVLVAWIPSPTAWFAGQALGMALGAVGAKLAFDKHISTQTDIPCQSHIPELIDRKAVLNYSLPLALSTGLMWVQLSGYRIVIEKYWGLEQLGFLVVGLQVSGQIWGLTESLATQFLYPLFYRRVSEYENRYEVERAFSDMLNTLVPIYFVITGFMISCAPYLLKVLVNSKFQDATFFVMLGAVIEMCRVLGNLLSSAAHVRRQTKSLALPYGVGAVTSMTLLYLVGVNKLQSYWAAACLLLGAILMLIVMGVLMYKHIKFKIDFFRFSIGGIVMFIMILMTNWLPDASVLWVNIKILILMGMFAGFVASSLLWNNPATLRLLNVQLRKN
jgi:O-antigen/teichoic acid export membrane protein